MSACRRRFSIFFFCFLVCLATQFAPSARPQANVQGQWQTLPYTAPINPIHVALLRTGKVLIVSGSGNLPSDKDFEAGLWDPQAGTITTQPVGWDMFCEGHVVLPDGRVFIAGGTIQYDPFYGQPKTSIYDPATNRFTDQQNMEHGRWYPTTTVLGDGRVMVFSGYSETGPTNNQVEIYTVGSGFGPAMAAPWTPPLYPRLHLLPNGTVFYSGSTPRSSIFNPSNNTWTMNVATTNYGGLRTYGSSVLMPLTPGNGYKPRVMIFGGGDQSSASTATTEIIDLSVDNPQWAYGPSMSQPRIEMDATMLPNGKILVSGGSVNDEDTGSASRNADMYDPTTNKFSSAGSDVFDRLYHSVTLLMPDATVWVAGGNPERGTYEPHMEIYSPPYLFNSDGTLATRPSIAGAPSAVGYGSAFQVQTPDAASIATVVLMRNGSSTHAFDMDQRYVGLAFTAGSGTLTVTGPPNGNIAPPGYYMMFLMNSAGVPSVAAMVQVTSAATVETPTGTITNPTSNVTIDVGQSVSYSGTGTSPDGSITGYSWSFPGGSPNASTLANPGTVIYSTVGTYTTTLTVTDSNGQTDPHPPTRTITVVSAPSAQWSPSSVSFGNQEVGSASTVHQVNLSNTGTATLNISGITASGDFSQTNTCAATLATGASCMVSVTFTPTQTGTRTGTLSVADDATGSPQTVSLTGTGVAPTAQWSPSTVTFGNQAVGSVSAGQQIKLNNNGTATLNISAIAVSRSFAQTNTCAATLAPGAGCVVSVTFNPTQVGVSTGTLSAADDASGSPQTVSLTGTGVAPTAQWSVSNLSFGNQVVGSAGTARQATLSNTGTTAMNISAIAASPGFSQTNTCGATLASGASCMVSVTFNPTQPGVGTGTLSAADDASGSPQTVSLTGTGIAPSAALAPASLTFASLLIGSSSPAQSALLTNTGTSTLNISGIAAAGDFSETSSCGSTLAPGASCAISVIFTPTQSGTRTGAVSVMDDATGSPQMIALSGVGGAPSAAVSLTPSSLTFAGELVGSPSSAQAIKLANTGTAVLHISAISAAGDFSETNTCGSTLSAGASCTINMTFKPTQGGTRNGTVTVVESLGNSQIALSGTGMDFSLTTAPNAGTLTAGQSAKFSVMVNAQGGFNQPASLTCTGAPTNATCNVSAPSVTPGNAATITVVTTAHSTVWPTLPALPKGFPLPMLYGLAIIALALWAMARPQRRIKLAFSGLAIVTLATSGCASVAGIAGGSNSNGSSTSPSTGGDSTPAGTYTITVTATSGALTHSATYTLTVQ
jgi:PKD repeat protein